jgi:nicotinamide riboside transporter PnuC
MGWILTKPVYNIGFAARLAGHWSDDHFIAVVLHPGWTYIVGLLFVNLYFYIFNQQRFRADEQ